MGYSMGLGPELKEQSDRLYNSDRVKFKGLAAWIARSRKIGYSESDMAEALRQFWDLRETEDWLTCLNEIAQHVVKVRFDERFGTTFSKT